MVKNVGQSRFSVLPVDSQDKPVLCESCPSPGQTENLVNYGGTGSMAPAFMYIHLFKNH